MWLCSLCGRWIGGHSSWVKQCQWPSEAIHQLTRPIKDTTQLDIEHRTISRTSIFGKRSNHVTSHFVWHFGWLCNQYGAYWWLSAIQYLFVQSIYKSWFHFCAFLVIVSHWWMYQVFLYSCSNVWKISLFLLTNAFNMILSLLCTLIHNYWIIIFVCITL